MLLAVALTYLIYSLIFKRTVYLGATEILVKPFGLPRQKIKFSEIERVSIKRGKRGRAQIKYELAYLTLKNGRKFEFDFSNIDKDPSDPKLFLDAIRAYQPEFEFVLTPDSQ